MNDRKLRDLFEQLPRHRARPGFSARVRHWIEDRNRPPLRGQSSLSLRALFLVPAAVTVLLVTLVLWWSVGGGIGGVPDSGAPLVAHGSSGPQDARQRLESLRREREATQRQLAQVRALLAEAPPVIYLGGTDSFDLVLDLTDSSPRPPTAGSSPTG